MVVKTLIRPEVADGKRKPRTGCHGPTLSDEPKLAKESAVLTILVLTLPFQDAPTDDELAKKVIPTFRDAKIAAAAEQAEGRPPGEAARAKVGARRTSAVGGPVAATSTQRRTRRRKTEPSWAFRLAYAPRQAAP